MSEFTHSKGPWSYELTDSMEDGEDAFVVQSQVGDVAEMSFGETAEPEAVRIVACVNACDRAGLSNEALAGGTLNEMVKIVDLILWQFHDLDEILKDQSVEEAREMVKMARRVRESLTGRGPLKYPL